MGLKHVRRFSTSKNDSGCTQRSKMLTVFNFRLTENTSPRVTARQRNLEQTTLSQESAFTRWKMEVISTPSRRIIDRNNRSFFIPMIQSLQSPVWIPKFDSGGLSQRRICDCLRAIETGRAPSRFHRTDDFRLPVPLTTSYESGTSRVAQFIVLSKGT